MVKVKVKKCKDGTYKVYKAGTNQMLAGPFFNKKEATKFSKYYKDDKVKKIIYTIKTLVRKKKK